MNRLLSCRAAGLQGWAGSVAAAALQWEQERTSRGIKSWHCKFRAEIFLHDCILSPYAQHFPVCRISQDIKECSNLNNKEISQLMRRTVERVIIVEICPATAECFCGYGIMVDTAGLKRCEERSPLLTGDCNSML